jgi:hypothetical protein
MALALANQLKDFYDLMGSDVRTTLKQVADAEWTSAGLPEGNAFTRTLVLRSAGVLVKKKALTRDEALKVSHPVKEKGKALKSVTFREVLEDLARGVPESLNVETKGMEYGHTTTLGYWFGDALANLQPAKTPVPWKRLVQWSSFDFRRQLTLLSANHDTLMDPISLAMAACLYQKSFTETEAITEISPNELNYSIKKLFERQMDSGNWPKYFPLFHYPNAGANHCFSYEMLEALINEFGKSRMFLQPFCVQGLEKALTWCENNRRNYRDKYYGWHSGGEVDTLKEGKPETWATAVVHIFLYRLQEVLSFHIQNLVLDKYHARIVDAPSDKEWNELIPVEVNFHKPEGKKNVKTILEEIEDSFRKGLKTKKRSALIFGPPGTSKTRMIRAFAKKLGQPIVEINPSHFVSQGLELVYVKANEVFDDLMDLFDAIIFFDEMDAAALQRTHKDEMAGVVEQFLTTFMLPKIANLYDNGKAIFFMATNHQKSVDPAIKRPGRFDFQLCIGPAKWVENFRRLDVLCEGLVSDSTELNKVKLLLDKWINSNIEKLLNQFTFGEIRALLESITRKHDKRLPEAMEDLGGNEFGKLVGYWHDSYIHLRKGEEGLKRYREDMKASKRQ